ncbi:GHKL domain-containing protein [Metasolibacillus sp.]|uniref:GHKL domain-containing protein n=1 Tax=Metasolibacillus sp. TaxID=2703680 RepID=UPI0025F1BB91|nr:GHKL domain-containing protein [Metasolibacillus sp.]MCT6926323.1 GHKL domain-containing protein [Metasolibacillus sp.]MCT6942584.1 GHKL domain-containing protein [Metasolibacillus sp.]
MLIYFLFESVVLISTLFYILNIQLNIKHLFIYLVLIILPSLLIAIYVSQLVAIPLLILTIILGFYRLTKRIFVIFDVLIVILTAIFLDNLSQLITSNLSNLFINHLVSYSLFIILFLGFAFVYKQYIRRKMISFQIPNAFKWFLLFIIALTLTVFYINVFYIDAQTNKELVKANFFVQIAYIALLLLGTALFLYNLNKNKEIKQREIAQQQFNVYIQSLEKVNMDMRKFRHDYNNILLSMRELIDQQDMENLQQYFYQNILPLEQNTLFENKLIGQLGKIEVMELKSLLSSKLLYASSAPIPIELEIPQPITAIAMESIDLTRIIGILMDNAIEASQEITQPQIHLALFQTEEETIIVIENNFYVQGFDITSLFENSFSTKGEGRGIGLTTVRELLYKYPHAILNTQVEGNRFIQELQIGGKL